MSDNIAVLKGYTRQIEAECNEYDLLLLVKPDTNLDEPFKAWDSDNQEFIRITSPWLFVFRDGPDN